MDLSMTSDMSYPEQIYHCYLNKLWAAYLQSLGMNVIPNVSWPADYHLDYWLDGLPRGSIISVSSVGISHSSRFGWLSGMERVWNELEPSHVIRYGSKVKGERETDCTYFNNDNNRAINGWSNSSNKIVI